MATGTVKVWSPGQGSGWIMPDAGGDRVYVHKSGIEGAGSGQAPRLEVGQRVDYQIGQRPKGSAAINVRPATAATAATVEPEATAEPEAAPEVAPAVEPLSAEPEAVAETVEADDAVATAVAADEG